MKRTKKILIVVLSFALVLSLFPLGELFAKGGRGSFGGSRSFSSRGFGGSKSFGGSRSTSPRFSTTPRSTPTAPRSSFGRTATSTFNRADIQRKYGVPRRQITSKQMYGFPRNTIVNHYGDYASGLMMGYLMGHTSWLWYMPFHPAFYYSQPVRVVNPDGTISYYPPTFDWGKFFMTWIIIGAIAFIIYNYFKNRRRRASSVSDLSKSSFG